MKRKDLIILGAILVVVFIVWIGIGLATKNSITNSAGSYSDCVNAGGTIIDTYPAQCEINGKTYTEDVTPPVSYPYYGSFTSSACNINTDCVVSGCNSEICKGSLEDAGASICLAPDKPLPKDLGYACGCVQQKCQWSK